MSATKATAKPLKAAKVKGKGPKVVVSPIFKDVTKVKQQLNQLATVAYRLYAKHYELKWGAAGTNIAKWSHLPTYNWKELSRLASKIEGLL